MLSLETLCLCHPLPSALPFTTCYKVIVLYHCSLTLYLSRLWGDTRSSGPFTLTSSFGRPSQVLDAQALFKLCLKLANIDVLRALLLYGHAPSVALLQQPDIVAKAARVAIVKEDAEVLMFIFSPDRLLLELRPK